MTIKAGDRIPSATLRRKIADGIEEIRTDDFFAGRRVVLFAVPGAFTPTCSERHLPGFVEHAAAIRDKGVDAIACVSVNDPFVMAAWGRDQGVGDGIVMLADADGAFTEALGMTIDLSAGGLGRRSRRYAMIVDDGVATAVEVEPERGVTVSSADSILARL